MRMISLFFPAGCLLLSSIIFAQSANPSLRIIVYRDVSATHLPVGTLTGNSMDAQPADLDGDGDLDLVIAMEFQRNIILINDGNGIFTNESNTRLPFQVNDSEDVGIADFDSDGDPDIVFVTEDDSTNELYLNNGSGFFSDASARLPVNGISNAVLAVDVNDDGAPDILIGNQGSNVLLLNDGNGFFTDESEARYPAGIQITQDLEWGDIDGDGDNDVIEGNEDGNRVLINLGGGFFTDETTFRLPLPAAGEETREADLGDADGDGDLDLFLANVTFQQGRPAQNRLLRNTGSGFFEDITATHLPVEFRNTVDGDFVDLDEDGDADIIMASAFNATYQIYINDGSGSYRDSTSALLLPTPAGSGIDIEAADFNGDGLPDLYLTGFQQSDYLYLGDIQTGIALQGRLPQGFLLHGNYPNPFNPATTIVFELGHRQAVELVIFDSHGRQVAKPVREVRDAGIHRIAFPAHGLASGVYFYRLTTPAGQQTQKMLLLQ